VLCRTVVTVTIEHAPPIPPRFVAAASFAPLVLTISTVIVSVEVEVVVKVVVGSFAAIDVAAKFAGATVIGNELAPAAKAAGATEFAAGAAEFPPGAAVALCI
jgi:hypothetical protein